MLFNTKFILLTSFVCSLKICLSQKVEECDFNPGFMFNVIKVPQAERWKLPPGFLSTPEIIQQNGFGCEEFEGVTEDGYVLRYHRVLTETPGGQPVLMVHGLLMSSDGWLMTGRKTDLALQLADAGYDVWLGDNRGNWYSRKHISLTPDKKEFWDFSFHEDGVYDLPVFIDAILNATMYPQIIVFAVSMGTNEILALLSMKPEYNAKVKATILLSPVVMVTPARQSTSYFLKLLTAVYSDPLYKLLRRMSLVEIMPRTYKLTETIRKCCHPKNQLQICLDLISIALGDHRENYNMTTIDYFITHFPAGGSLKTIYHMMQIFKTGEFALFDNGPYENLLRYNTTITPQYPLEQVTSPVAIYWSENDAFVTKKVIEKLAARFPNLVEVYKVPDPKYAHMDFLWGKNTASLVNSRVMEVIKRI